MADFVFNGQIFRSEVGDPNPKTQIFYVFPLKKKNCKYCHYELIRNYGCCVNFSRIFGICLEFLEFREIDFD